jgi:hypothetical protein
LVFAFAGPVVGPARAQAGGEPEFVGVPEESFVLFQNERGETVCRVATPAERERIRAAAATHVIYHGAPRRRKVFASGDEVLVPNSVQDSSGLALLPSAGLTIVLQGTAQLDANPTARAAFIAAANRWESIISTPITVTLSVDFGPNFFDQGAYPGTSILGQTGSAAIRFDGNDPSLAAVRSRLINNSNPTASELQLYNALPTDFVPAEYNGSTVNVSNVRVNTSQARALGFSFTMPPGAADAQIGFNSNFGPAGNPGQFDFDPSDGITAGHTDFDAVVVHEIGHALGFVSANGGSSGTALSIWDLFRFRPGTADAGNFGSAPRVLTRGGSQVMFGNFTSTYASQELGLSTGGPSGSSEGGGDGRQSSHWQDDQLLATRPFIGIMDPILSRGVRRTLTENDIRTVDLIGYSVVFDPARPANDNFANAARLSGASGSVAGNNTWATREPGEPPMQAGYTSDKSVWFAWTAPATGLAAFDTTGSGFDTTLGVYTGGAVGALTSPSCVVCQNDDANDTTQASRVGFNAVAGTVYYLNVDGWNSEYGPVQLNWTSSGTTTPVSYSVSGRVADPAGNGLQGVRLAIDGPNLVNSFPHLPVTTDAGGNFRFSLLTPGGNYTVRPEDSRYTLSPASAVFVNIGANQTADFTATSTAAPATVPVTGRVVEGTQGLQGVLVGLYGGGVLLQQTTTGVDGRWTFAAVGANQGYSTYFVRSGYAFTPPGLAFPVGQIALDMGDVFARKGNPIDETSFFVAQHYRDFLGREPDAPGLSFWTGEIEGCGLDLRCREVKRVNVSAAFFQSIEFRNTGYLVERMYKAAYGDRTETSTGLVVPAITRAEFTQDTPLIGAGVVVNVADWATKLENNKVAYAQAFVRRQRFTAIFGALTPAQFVDRLDANAGRVLTANERSALIDELAANDTEAGRASVLRRVAENAELERRERNRAFVLMEYFGYLRRNPSDAPEANLNYAGWNFWLGKLDEFDGNFVAAEMVKAFLDSVEYRNRFAQ